MSEYDHRTSDNETKTNLSNRSSVSSLMNSRTGDVIFDDYNEILTPKAVLSEKEAEKQEHLEKPFDFYEDEEFACGVDLLNNNIACVGGNISKLVKISQEPWPDNVKLFQPYEVEQILLPDNASCLAVQAFLKMCNLPFEVEMRWNAEFMSPSGRVPFIKCGAFVVSELEPIAQFAANKGVSLCNNLSTEEKAEMRAYMSLITNVLVNAELYISWIDNDTFNQVTKVRNSSVYPWPLGWLQTRSKRNSVAKRLKALHWHDKTLDQVLADVEQCCNSLSQRLGDKDYFFGTPTQLDALVYGHIRALMSARGPKTALMIRPITNSLLQLVCRITNLVDMKLTPQEEYLMKQASIVRRRSASPRSEKSYCGARAKRSASPRSEMSYGSGRVRRSASPRSVLSYGSIRARRRAAMRNRGDSSGNNVFGFKPFANKKIVIMISNDGDLTCNFNKMKYGAAADIDEDTSSFEYTLAGDIIEDVMDKVDETILDNNIRIKNDRAFEIIAFPNQTSVSNTGSLDDVCGFGNSKESDLTERSVSFDATYEDVIHVINEDPERDSDLDDDKYNQMFPGASDDHKDDSPSEPIFLSQDWTEPSSKILELPEECVTTNPISVEQESVKEEPLKEEAKSPSATIDLTESKLPIERELSVESLLQYLRQQRSPLQSRHHDVVDVD